MEMVVVMHWKQEPLLRLLQILNLLELILVRMDLKMD